jgi:hypothetical protein
VTLPLPSHAGETTESGYTLFTELDVRGVSEAMAVVDTIDGFDGNLNKGGDFAYTHNEARIGVKSGDWAISAYYRYDYYLDFDPDTAELLYQRTNDLPVETGRSYTLDLEAIHARGAGVSVDYSFRFSPSFSLKTRASLLRAYDVVDGSIKGAIEILEDGTYSGSAEVNYFYGEDYLFDRPDVDQPKAWGGTLDLFAEYRINKEFLLRAQVEDAVSHIDWDDAPVTIATANSGSRARLDENGLLDVQPFLSGIETEQDFDQEFPRRYRARLDYFAPGPFDWQFEGNMVQGERYYRLNSSYSLSDHLHIDFAAGFQTKALGMGVRYKGFEFFVMSDELDFTEARALEVRSRLFVAF